jgi:PKD repeat protein
VSYTGHKVSFKYSGSGTPEAYYWNFGDGTISREKAPSHTYKKAGTVKPCLSVKCNGVWVPKTMCKAVNVK